MSEAACEQPGTDGQALENVDSSHDESAERAESVEDKGNGDEENFLFEDDSSEDEAMVTIGDIKKNVPFQKQNAAVAGKVDMDGQPAHNGSMIYDLDLASMEDKPWQKPGADITDYFNYGFNEETWNSYCERQRKLRAEYGTQKEINRAIANSININFNAQPISTNFSNQSGRQLVNVVGPEKPQKLNKMVIDLSKPPPMVDQTPVMRTIIPSNTPLSQSFDGGSIPSSPSDGNTIPVLNFNKPPPGLANFNNPASSSSNLPPVPDGPPGVDDMPSSPTQIPQFDSSMPPPNFNPAVPPPGIGRPSLGTTNLAMHPPVFNQVPMYASAGFGSTSQYSSGRPHGRGDYSPTRNYEETKERHRRESDDDDDYRRRRRKRSRSHSPRRSRDERSREDRIRDDRSREDRSSPRRGSSSSRKHRDEKKRTRDYSEEYDRDRKRRKHDRRRSRTPDRNEISDAPPGVSDAPPGVE